METLDITEHLQLICQELPRGVLVMVKGRLELNKKEKRLLAKVCGLLVKSRDVSKVLLILEEKGQAKTQIFTYDQNYPAQDWPLYTFPVQDYRNAESLILRARSHSSNPTPSTHPTPERETNGNR
jgi:hypothetical protein